MLHPYIILHRDRRQGGLGPRITNQPDWAEVYAVLVSAQALHVSAEVQAVSIVQFDRAKGEADTWRTTAARRALLVWTPTSVFLSRGAEWPNEAVRFDRAHEPALMPSCTNSSTPSRWYEGRLSYSFPTKM